VILRNGAVRPDPTADIDGYLARLGLERPARPDVEWLFAAHRAHMERIPYENFEIQLDRPTSVDPAETIARIVRGRGGYCFHLNGALGTLLAALGYDVTRHLGEVRGAEVDQESTELTVNHQVLTVLCEGETWFVDCGLGDAPYEPMPLRADVLVTQGPFTYMLQPWTVRPGGWRFVHDPGQESFVSMVFAPEPVEVAAFAQAHHRLSTSPDSSFVRAAIASRRDARGADVLRGRVLYRIDGDGVTKQPVDAADAWFELLADLFGLHLPDVDAGARAALWARVSAAHEQWLAERAAAAAADAVVASTAATTAAITAAASATVAADVTG
jgi:arylamine N-acetyltransferase